MRQKSALLVCCVVWAMGCELVSGLDDLEFVGGKSPVAGAPQGGNAEGGAGGMAAGGAGGVTGGEGTGGMPPAPIDELFIGKRRFSCARRGTDHYCWGQALGADPNILAPVLTPMPDGTEEVDFNDPNCARSDDGEVICWGTNEYGRLGNGSTQPADRPVLPVLLSAPALDVEVSGADWGCALVDSAVRSVECWGRNSYGMLLPPGDEDPHPVPMQVASTGFDGDVDQLGVGFYTGCMRLGTHVECWGLNQQGALGIGTSGGIHPPTPIATSELVVELAVTDLGGCILSQNDEAFCWGEPWPTDGSVQAVPQLDGAHDIEAGDGHVCGIREGQPVCVGYNNVGQLGSNNNEDYFATPEVPGEVVQVAAGYELSCALTAAGEVYCWGRSLGGALGIGSAVDAGFPDPQLVTFPP